MPEIPAPPAPLAARPGEVAGWRFWIDRGGTFTDLVAVDPAGRWHVDKLLSADPARYADAASHGIGQMLARLGQPGDRVDEVRLGTTVATNALLERAGARVLLIVTQGFADLPVIRSQDRPQLFRRHLERPAALFERVVEAGERLAVDGTVLRPLDAAPLRAALAAAHVDGIECVAICLLHAWAHPVHEQAVAQLAREAGFKQVFASHLASPLPRWVPRADTTVTDAYLTPVLQRYVQGFLTRIATLGAGEVAFMQSHGGLAGAGQFRGVDALLSGPAGGLVGLQGVGRAAGFERVIGFDMGGTSTDVALVDGALPRRPVNSIAGLTLQVPMLDIHTVAAGGGSVLRLRDGRLTAGPDSAGARPGPCCYRNGGPLAVTDANVMLGRLVPSRFPQVFGPTGDAPLDTAAVEAAFTALAADAGGTPAALAEDCLAVAVSAMANAVRHVALRAGHDPAQFTLVSFGGAGGQHACQVAEALGMQRVLVHPLASVLSAVGIGLAPRRAVRRRGFGQALEDARRADLVAALEVLASAARAAVEAGAGTGPARLQHLLHLSVPGADATLPITWAAEDTTAMVTVRFAEAFRQRYGFAPSPADLAPGALTVDALEVEAVADAGRRLQGAPTLARTPHLPGVTRAWFDGRWQEVPLLDRAALPEGAVVSGPALVTEDGATTVVMPGWQAARLAHAELLMTRRDAAAAPAPGTADAVPTPARLEVFNGLFMQVAEQMGLVLRDAARSVNVKERLDFSCAVFDADGALVANAPHMPVHLGSMGASVRAVCERVAARGETVEAGDSWLVNVPWGGGTHLPDVTAVSPVCLDGEDRPRFWVASRAHHADLGGITPGSMPPGSTHIDEEGIAFDAVRVVHRATFDEAGLRACLAGGPWPARNPDQNVADVRAQLAANARGDQELRRLCAQHGAAQVGAYMRHVQDNAEAAVRTAIGALTDGHCTVPLDAGMEIRVAIRVDRARGEAEIDFTGTSPQDFPRAHNFHAPHAVTTAAVLYVFRTLIDHDLPLNEGCLRPLRLVVPEGSLLNPRRGAAVVAGNVETSQAVVDALYGALGLLAASQGTMNNLTFGDATHQYYETIAGGAGAGPGFAGASGIQTHMTNSRLTDPEILEARFPVRLEQFGFRRGSGGAGRWPGGDGLTRELTFLAPLTVGLLSQRRLHAPFGLAGGGNALPGTASVHRADGTSEALGPCAIVTVSAGDRLRIDTPGGGGYGAVPDPDTSPRTTP